MATPELVQERFISGRGVLKIPSDGKKNRYTVLYLDVIRQPVNRFANLNWNPARGRYAQLVFLRNEYVIDTRAMEFPRESYDGIADIAGQTLIAVKCAYDGILQTFFNLGNALALPSISVVNLIEEYENLRLGWDEVRIVCYADTAIQARLYRTPYDVCNPDYDDQQEPPPPPPPAPPVPPGTPLTNLSPPYDGDNDDGNTDLFPGDESVPSPLEPPGEACVKYRVVIEYEQAYGDPLTTKEIICYGEIGEPFIQPSGGARAVVLPCRGYAFPTLDEGCLGGLVNRTVFVSDSVAGNATPEIVLFEEYSP